MQYKQRYSYDINDKGEFTRIEKVKLNRKEKQNQKLINKLIKIASKITSDPIIINANLRDCNNLKNIYMIGGMAKNCETLSNINIYFTNDNAKEKFRYFKIAEIDSDTNAPKIKNITINEKLRHLRKSKKMTQKEVADKIGVSSRVYAYYEQDRFPKNETTLKNLASALDTTISYLIEK